MADHTPVPWKIGFDDGSGVEDLWIVGPNEKAVVHGRGDCCHMGGIHEEENARFIVQACNAHDDLLAALEEAADALEEVNEALEEEVAGGLKEEQLVFTYIGRGRAAIAKASAKPQDRDRRRETMHLKDVEREIYLMLAGRSSEAQGKTAYRSLYQAVVALRDKVEEALAVERQTPGPG